MTNVAYDSDTPSIHLYIVHTLRGRIRTARVVLCTNGYLEHLLPRLRRIAYPYREKMTVQDLGTSRRESRCWGIVQKPGMADQSKAWINELVYLQQNAESGDYHIGGGFNTPSEIVNADDSFLDQRTTAYLQSTLSDFLGVLQSSSKLVSTRTGSEHDG